MRIFANVNQLMKSPYNKGKFLNSFYNSLTTENNHNSYSFSTQSPPRQSTTTEKATTAEKVITTITT